MNFFIIHWQFFLDVEVTILDGKTKNILHLTRIINFNIVASPDSIGSLVAPETFSLKISGGFLSLDVLHRGPKRNKEGLYRNFLNFLQKSQFF